MLIVGERINTSRKDINEAVEKRDAAFITADVQKQVKAGADYIDVNAGSRIGSELEDLNWLVEVVEAAVDVPLALDSPDPKALKAMARKVKKRPMINSTTAESNRFAAMKAIVQERECDVVALCMDDRGIPKTVEEALRNASFLMQNLTKLGIPIERIHLDPMIQPISVNKDNGILAFETIRNLRREFPGVRTICGLSNVSFGLPSRFLVNRLFMVLCIGAGLTGAIVDPLDQKIMTSILVSETLMGKDDFCLKFLKANRAGTLVG
ncbi:MAG: methyltetrahydrofolate cobalamin methyltransferase [Deltaproteobacteria bacterium]|nr:methyltetrahydrofolate cobalamin methyltransferase [Deltaproteobacteria bacterium]